MGCHGIRLSIIKFSLLLLASCASIAGHDNVAVLIATDAKVDADELIKSATVPASEKSEEIEKIKLDCKKAYEYSRMKSNNNISAKQWQIMISPDRKMLGGFIKMWEERGRGFSEAYLLEVRDVVAAGFDEIIKLENAK